MDKTNTRGPFQENITVYYHNYPELLARGTAFHWWDAAYTSLHDHDYYEFFIITSGRTKHFLNGESQELGEKTLCLIRPQDRHQFTPMPDSRCIHINLPVTREKLEQLCAAVGTSLRDLLLVPQRQLLLSDTDFAQFKQSAREINLLRENGTPESSICLLICQMVVNAIVILKKQDMVMADGAPEWLHQVIRRIHSPEYIACQASDIYRLAGYSPPVVIRSFRKYTGNGCVLPHPGKNGLCQASALHHGPDGAGHCRPPGLQQRKPLQPALPRSRRNLSPAIPPEPACRRPQIIAAPAAGTGGIIKILLAFTEDS